MPYLKDLENIYAQAKKDKEFRKELTSHLRILAGSPTPLYFAEHLSAALNSSKIYFKIKDQYGYEFSELNNYLGQALLAKRMRKKNLIFISLYPGSERLVSLAASRLGLKCTIFICARNLAQIMSGMTTKELRATEFVCIPGGKDNLRNVIYSATKAWIADSQGSFLVMKTATGPHPYPTIVRDFYSVLGQEVKEEIIRNEGKDPNFLFSYLGPTSHALGLFYPFLGDPHVHLIGVGGLENKPKNSLYRQRVSILGGFKSYCIPCRGKNISPTGSIDNCNGRALEPELAYLSEINRFQLFFINETEAKKTQEYLELKEGIRLTVDSACIVAQFLKILRSKKKNYLVAIYLNEAIKNKSNDRA